MAEVTRRVQKTKKSKRLTRPKTKLDVDLYAMYGAVPSFKGKNPNLELAHALNWCTRGIDANTGKKELLFWLGENGLKDVVKPIRAVDEMWVLTAGKLAFLANNGWPLGDDSVAFIKLTVEKYVETGKKLLSDRATAAVDTDKLDRLRLENSVSPETQHLIEATTLFEDIQAAMWKAVEFPEEGIRKLVKGKKAVILDKVVKSLKELGIELNQFGVVSNDDMIVQVQEYYAKFSKRQVKRIISHIEEAIALMNNEKVNKTVGRKPRVAKTKSAAQLIARLKYNKEDTSLNIVSVDPMSIVGALKMVVFNTKTRKIGLYVSANERGFSIKGTTITNFDPDASLQKTVRDTKTAKMADVVRGFRSAPIKRGDMMFTELTTTPTKMNGRFNTDLLVLKVYK